MMHWKRFTLGGWFQPRPEPSRTHQTSRTADADEPLGAGPVLGAGAPGEFTDPYFMAQPTCMSLEVDDALQVPVAFNEQTAAAVLEVTQRAREYREREKRSIPPVYNFGSDNASWSSGANW